MCEMLFVLKRALITLTRIVFCFVNLLLAETGSPECLVSEMGILQKDTSSLIRKKLGHDRDTHVCTHAQTHSSGVSPAKHSPSWELRARNLPKRGPHMVPPAPVQSSWQQWARYLGRRLPTRCGLGHTHISVPSSSPNF